MAADKADPNKNPQNMGGPSFHPNVGKDSKKQDVPARDTMDKKQVNDDGAILDEDQVPPL